jgi:hypothetical protein
MSDNFFTPEREIEWAKCCKDFKYFAKQYLKIQNPEKGMIPFELYEFQERVIKDYEEHKLNIISKFRQGGLTTLTVLWMLWRCMFKFDQMILVMSKTDREAIKAGKILSKALQDIKVNHPWLYPELMTDTHHEKMFKATNSSIEFRTIKAARGQSLTYIVIDEAAFINDMKEAWKDLYPTVAAGGRVIAISTVNGRGNWYEETFTDALAGRNTFHIIDIKLEEHPVYRDPEWIKNTKANMSPRDWAQEFERSFLSSGNSYFSNEVLVRCESRAREAFPIQKKFPEWDSDKLLYNLNENDNTENWDKGALWFWKLPESGQDYIVSVDAAQGIGDDGDNSAIQVINQNTLEQVAEFCSNIIQPNQLAMVAAQLGSYYNTALMVVETNGPGQTVIDKLVNMFYYENLYFNRIKTQDRPGVIVNPSTRPLILEAIQNYLQNDFLKVNSLRLVREMDTFVFDRTRKKVCASRGKHDDLIMSIAFAVYVREKSLRQMPVGVTTNQATDHRINNIFEEIKKEIYGNVTNIMPKDDPLLWKPQVFIPGLPDGFQRKGEKILKEFNW